MKSGMLWYDNEPNTSLDEKISLASDYFRKKYGHTPDVCMVNPLMLAGSALQDGTLFAGKIQVRTMKTIMPGHFWLGVEDQAVQPPA